jgi:hypothetical protein
MIVYPKAVRDPPEKRIKDLSNEKDFREPKYFPDKESFETLSDIAFHASFLTEEKRRPGFRLTYCRPTDVSDDVLLPWRAITFPSPRPLTVGELNRIAPAPDPVRFLVCVCPQKPTQELGMWGLLDVGENWWKFIHHETTGGTAPPQFLTITSTAHGELSYSIGADILLTLKNGALSQPSINPIWDGPVADFLNSERQRLYTEVLQKLQVPKWAEDPREDAYPKRFYNYFLERILFNVRLLGHGGTVLVVPDELSWDDPRIADRIIFKYAINYDSAWNTLVRALVNRHRHDKLYFPLVNGVKPINSEIFENFAHLDYEMRVLEEDLQDIAKSTASFAAVDGALVLTTRFRESDDENALAANPFLNAIVMIPSSCAIHLSEADSFDHHASAFRS